MKIIEVNHKTVASLLKKSVVEHWLEKEDVWLKFTDGSIMCIHVLNPKYWTYVSMETKDNTNNGPTFNDSSNIYLWFSSSGYVHQFTSRTVSIYFNNADYYISDKLEYPARQYVPIIEFHYYEEGESLGDYDS